MQVKDVSEVWPENEGKLVYIQGFMKLSGEGGARDRNFGIEIRAPFLIREAEML